MPHTTHFFLIQSDSPFCAICALHTFNDLVEYYSAYKNKINVKKEKNNKMSHGRYIPHETLAIKNIENTRYGVTVWIIKKQFADHYDSNAAAVEALRLV